jgi:hypothetical protein
LCQNMENEVDEPGSYRKEFAARKT